MLVDACARIAIRVYVCLCMRMCVSNAMCVRIGVRVRDFMYMDGWMDGWTYA